MAALNELNWPLYELSVRMLWPPGASDKNAVLFAIMPLSAG